MSFAVGAFQYGNGSIGYIGFVCQLILIDLISDIGENSSYKQAQNLCITAWVRI